MYNFVVEKKRKEEEEEAAKFYSESNFTLKTCPSSKLPTATTSYDRE